jgi:hypothetical protein
VEEMEVVVVLLLDIVDTADIANIVDDDIANAVTVVDIVGIAWRKDEE